MAFLRNRSINWINLHTGIQALAQGMGGLFVLVFLLRAGVSIPASLCAMALIFVGRFGIRPLVIASARRFGLKPLVIAGSRAWGSDAELRLLQKDEIQPLKATFRNVRRIDYLPRQLLMRLVRGAKAVAFPSLYEGFGLPALEAMMLGTPVLTSNTSSLPEVVGDAALKVDPYKTGEIAAALRQLDTDAALRARLSAAGIERARLFSMEAYQDRLGAMYDRILK